MNQPMELLNLQIEVTFKHEEDTSWMRVWMSVLKYRDILTGIPFEGLTLRYILTETVEDEDENSATYGQYVGLVYDTFLKEWHVETIIDRAQ